MFQSVVNHFANQFSGQTLQHQARNRGVSVEIVFAHFSVQIIIATYMFIDVRHVKGNRKL